MKIAERLDSFAKLGITIKKALNVQTNPEALEDATMKQNVLQIRYGINTAVHQNGWFVPEFVQYALMNIAESLSPQSLMDFAGNYPLPDNIVRKTQKIGLVMAGNIPMVGFHDLFCVLITGNIAVCKLSSKDEKLIKILCECLINIRKDWSMYIQFEDRMFKQIDKVIATGSNNSARYFDYYFAKYPHIIRKNRNSVAVLSGNETEKDFEKLADDIFLYFGMGCRNVSKIFIPTGYNITKMFPTFEKYSFLGNYQKYFNNYLYNRTVGYLNAEDHFDAGFFIAKRDTAYSSAVTVFLFEEYLHLHHVTERLVNDSDKIQCIVSQLSEIKGAIQFGQTQKTKLTDFADNVDTIRFLIS